MSTEISAVSLDYPLFLQFVDVFLDGRRGYPSEFGKFNSGYVRVIYYRLQNDYCIVCVCLTTRLTTRLTTLVVFLIVVRFFTMG